MFARISLGLFCSIGLVIQTYYISKQYFAYGTVTSVSLSRDKYVIPPALVVCLELANIKDFYENTTIKKLFEAFPTKDQFIIDLTLHSNFNYSYSSVDPNVEMSIKVGIRQNQICYSLALDIKNIFRRTLITNSFKPP